MASKLGPNWSMYSSFRFSARFTECVTPSQPIVAHPGFYCIYCEDTLRVSVSLQACYGYSISKHKSHIALTRLEGTITNLLGSFSVILFWLCLCVFPREIQSSLFMWTVTQKKKKTHQIHFTKLLWCPRSDFYMFLWRCECSEHTRWGGERIETSGGGLEADGDK